MKIIMVMVMSADGRITKGNNPDIYSWTSQEDQRHFFQMIAKNNLIVMGRKTYKAARPNIRLKKGKLRIVCTRNPEKYRSQQVEDQLEFTRDPPLELVSRLEKKGYRSLLLVGGAQLNSAFLKSGIVDKIYITVEPRIFGKGKVSVDGMADTRLKLLRVRRLNKQGTLLLTYNVVK